MIAKDLGIATAYGYAKSKGYTGTEDEFATLMASYASVAQQAADSASAASGSATSANTSALKSEGYAVGKQNGSDVASGSPYYENNAKYYAEQVEGALDDYAEIDGYYEDMSVGNAEQIISSVYEEDKVPYNFRTSGGSIDIGDREYDTVVGGTVAWNQLVQTARASTTVYDLTLTRSEDLKSLTISGTPNNSGNIGLLSVTITAVPNHVYLASIGTPGVEGAVINMHFTGDVGVKDILYKPTSVVNLGLNLKVTSGTSVNITVKPQIFDLTQMFGSTIADYIYSLETATPGAGVSWFRKLFPKDYYAYDARSLQSVNAASHVMTGFNQWDEVTEKGYINTADGTDVASNANLRSKNYIPILPNTTYYFKATPGMSVNGAYYDANKAYVSALGDQANKTFTTPANAHYFRFYLASAYGTTYNHDICINLHWDGERDGEYEAYKERTYALDSDLTLRGIPKLDSNNKLYYDGDVYEADGTVTRRYAQGVFDGSSDENWSLQSTNTYGIANFSIQVSDYAGGPNNTYSNKAIANMFSPQTTAIAGTETEGWWMHFGKTLYLRIKSTTASTVDELKTWLSTHNFVIVYELATPTTESADPYQTPQSVDNWGTEAYTDYAYEQGTRDFAIPVGHDTKYTADLRSKIETAPASPDGAGDYIVRQTSGENEYVLLSSNTTITALETRVPACPTDTDGTFVLKATVSSGAVTYAWTAES